MKSSEYASVHSTRGTHVFTLGLLLLFSSVTRFTETTLRRWVPG